MAITYKKISDLAQVAPVGADFVELLASGQSKRASLDDILDLLPSTVFGRSLLTATDAAAGRALLNAARTDGANTFTGAQTFNLGASIPSPYGLGLRYLTDSTNNVAYFDMVTDSTHAVGLFNRDSVRTAFTIQGASGQSRPLLELQDSLGAMALACSEDGSAAYINSGTGRELKINQGSAGGNYGFTLTTSTVLVIAEGARLRVDPYVASVGLNMVIGWTNGAANNSLTTGLARAVDSVVEINNGTRGGAGSTLRSMPASLSQITADQNNYNPGVARFYRLSSDASRTITGLSISQVDGQEFEIWNVGSFNIVLANESASSTAANRFTCSTGADITLAPNEIACIRYDDTTDRFRVFKG